MNKRLVFSILLLGLLVVGCSPKQPRASHVIVLGFDAMSARGIQRAQTPNLNQMIENGAVSLHTRCVRETVSSQNWMSMVSGAPIEIHGVFTNGWKPGAPENVPPALANAKGFYPTVFDDIRAQRPELKQYAFVEWTAETRMYDMDAFDYSSVYRIDTTLHQPLDVIRKAFDVYLQDRPEVLFLSMDITDHLGHTFGHESQEYFDGITCFDTLIGDFVRKLEERGWMKETVILITADHGGIGYGHGGDTMAEFEIPIILYGKGVTKGKVLQRTSMIYDVAATVAGLLGVELPWECRGKFLSEAFEPKDSDATYAPIPLVHPFEGQVEGPVVITADASDAQIYYTLDGTDPDENATLYTGPFTLDKACEVRSIVKRGTSWSGIESNFLFPDRGETPVFYRLWRNYSVCEMPDFTKFGKADASGYIKDLTINAAGAKDEDYFAILFSSNFVADEDADYTFELKADDGANLWIDGKLLVNNENAHSVKSPKFGTVHLNAGRHPLKIEYYEYTKQDRLELRMRKGDGPFRPVTPLDLAQ